MSLTLHMGIAYVYAIKGRRLTALGSQHSTEGAASGGGAPWEYEYRDLNGWWSRMV